VASIETDIDIEEGIENSALSDDLLQHFPNLSAENYCVTSSETEAYNCHAWAAGENTRSWAALNWPAKYFWPEGLPRGETLDNYVLAFESLGYIACDSQELDQDFQKIAIYATEDRLPTHTARQLPSGRWTSKLGDWEDIRHDTLTALETDGILPAYGKVAVVMQRRRL